MLADPASTAQTLSSAQLSALLQNAHTIEADNYGLKVARLPDGDFVKLYRRKRLLSRALWSPPARRFADHAARLRTLGFVTPEVVAWWRIQASRCALCAVRYHPLPGETLRQRWPGLNSAERESEVTRFGMLLARLHRSGVYFRSVHLGNVIRLPDGEFGLIDLSDMRIGKRALSLAKRQRNFRHILRYREDAVWLVKHHRDAWLQGYEQAAGTAVQALAQSLEKHYGL